MVFIKDKQYAAMSEVIGISYSLEHKQHSTFYERLLMNFVLVDCAVRLKTYSRWLTLVLKMDWGEKQSL